MISLSLFNVIRNNRFRSFRRAGRLNFSVRYRLIQIKITCFKRVLTTLAGEVQGIVTILGTGGGITKIGAEKGKGERQTADK